MSCPPGTTIRYDIFFRTFPHPTTHVVKVDELLTFCLTISGTTITGTVNSIVPLNGTNETLNAQAQVDRISLNFRWGNTRVFAEGFTFPDSAGRRECLLRFTARAPGPPDSREESPETTETTLTTLAPPDEGDTGTGTGQQT